MVLTGRGRDQKTIRTSSEACDAGLQRRDGDVSRRGSINEVPGEEAGGRVAGMQAAYSILAKHEMLRKPRWLAVARLLLVMIASPQS